MPYCITSTARKLRAQGMTYVEVAEQLNTHPLQARSWVLADGLADPSPCNKRSHSRKAKYSPEVMRTAWELRDKGMRWSLIAQHLQVSQTSAMRYAKRFEEQQLQELMQPVSV